ncbi:UDP-glucuronate 4-epimerase 3 [Tanacetum coccineum]
MKLQSSSSNHMNDNNPSTPGESGFVGTHVIVALKRCGDGVLGLDNFNDCYEPSLKRARQALLERSGVYVVEGDINDGLGLEMMVVPMAR